MAILIDTSVLVAAAFVKDADHLFAVRVLRSLRRDELIVPMPVLVELFHMVTVRINYERAAQVFAQTRAAFQMEGQTELDLARMQQIMEVYRDARFDFVDIAIMAVSERLDIRQICTFDRRDFPMFRPSHCEYLELLP